MVIIVPSIIITLFCFFLLALSYHSNHARLMNGFLATIAIGWFIISVTLIIMGYNDPLLVNGYVIILTIIAFSCLLVYFFQGFFWLGNAFFVWRRENHSIANALTLVLGIITIVFPMINIFLAKRQLGSVGIFIYTFVVLLILYLLFCVVSFMLAALLFTFQKPRPNKDFIIVLGAGLLNGSEVSPLLASRINKGIQFYQQVKQTTGKAPLLICSGGQGGDEKIPEGIAMREYAIHHGVDAGDVVAEMKSKTTLQNMLFSKQIVEQKQLPLDSGIYVSNDYHLFRAGIYAHRAGLNIQGLGAKTSKFFVPNATIREYIALLMNHKRFHVVMISFILIVAIAISFLTTILR